MISRTRPSPGFPRPKSPKRSTHAKILMSTTTLIPKRLRKNGIARMNNVSDICDTDIRKDNVTSPENTPSNCRYVGPNDNDILTDLNLNSKVMDAEFTAFGFGLTDGNSNKSGENTTLSTRNTTYSGGPTASRSDVSLSLMITAVVSYGNPSENNKEGRNFDGVRFDASMLQSSYGTSSSVTKNYEGSLDVQFNNSTFSSRFGTPKGQYAIPAGKKLTEASVFIPAKRINMFANFKGAVINAGSANSGLILQDFGIKQSFPIKAHSTIYSK